MKRPIILGMTLMLVGASAQAQDISGTWQGEAGHRHVLTVERTRGGEFRGQFYNLGRESAQATLNGNTVSRIAVGGGKIAFQVDRYLSDFDGKLSADGDAMVGTWRVDGESTPLTLRRATGKSAWTIDPSPHSARFIPVDKGVTLEVLDWDGNGPPLVLLAGLGNTAHVFDDFAPKLTATRHVYAITRRGFGLSTMPPATIDNYDSDRLADDVLAVMEALGLKRPVLAGHSIAGQELSSIGSRHPEKISGLVYLDAAYGYAFYDAAQGEQTFADGAAIQRKLRLLASAGPHEGQALISEIEAIVPDLQRSLRIYHDEMDGVPDYSAWRTPQTQVYDAIWTSGRRYDGTKTPTLAFFAIPKKCTPDCDRPWAKARAAAGARQAEAFEKGNPKARVVRLPYASHYVFRSNEADVLREMTGFMDGLPKP